MQIGVGIDQRLGLTTAQLRDLAPAARALGYQSIWTNASLDYDPVVLCASWHATSGLATGISVVPIARNPAAVLGLAARTAHEVTGGAFTLGIGAGGITEKPIAAVRAYLADVRTVAPDVSMIVGALGPQMLRLAGREAQGAALNWCTPEQVAWSRERAGPNATMVDYVRVCVDEDVPAARLALAEQILAYALLVRPRGRGPGLASGASVGASGYRTHFERMGFAEELAFLSSRRAAGASDAELARVMPERLLETFGYAGRGDGAQEWFARMSRGLDVAIVRILTPRPGDPRPVDAAMRAFAPSH